MKDDGRDFRFLLLLVVVLLVGGCSQPAEVASPAAAPRSTPPATAASTLAPTITALPPTSTATVEATATPFAPPDLRRLQTALDEALADFDGIASYFVADLESGQVVERQSQVAISGMSMVKIPILLETYRALEGTPNVEETKLITETATLSGNYTANLLLELVAGRPDPFAGAVEVTRSLRRLGLYDTFIAVPYDLEARSQYQPTYATLANQRDDVNTSPDPSMQTTTRDLGRLLQMIYDCSQGEGALLERYPESLTASECQALLTVMEENRIDAFIEAGVPREVPLAHKHGWVGDTHGDAGIVFAPDHPYVLVIALHRRGWLEWEESTAIIAELSRLTYAHFTDPDAYPAAQLATPLPPQPAATATPALLQALVGDTAGAGLTLRQEPAGEELLVLPEGLQLYLAAEEAVEANGVLWQQVLLPDGRSGWVGAGYLERRPDS